MTRTRTRALLAAVGLLVVVLGFVVGLALGSRDPGSPATAAPSATPTPAGSGLASELPTSVYGACVPQSASSARCTPATPGVDELLVRRWPDAAAMRADFAAGYGSKPDGKCGSYTGSPPSGLRSTWGGRQPLACYVNSNGAAVVLWEYDDQALQVLAIRTDGDARAAFAWWTEAVKTPLPS